MKKFYILFFVLLFANNIFSQKETSNWIFGENNWLEFIDDSVSVQDFSFGDFIANRNTVSISDKEGNLLFYSNGVDVFDRNHQVMPNGHIGDPTSSPLPIFAIPKPNTGHSYYIIYHTSSSSLRWTEVDMSLNNGLGDVTLKVNNEQTGDILLNNSSGIITAVLHDNLTDIWIVGHSDESSLYRSWLATSSGIESTIVSSNIGSTFINGASGEIKTSIDGSKIAAVNSGVSKVDVFDFNRATGELSNEITINYFASGYGVEFSPSAQYLYVTHKGFQSISEILQFDLSLGDQDSIINSRTKIGAPVSMGTAGGLQLNPNGKIYCVNKSDSSLAIIHQPNHKGLDCNYEQVGINWTGASQTSNHIGLPAFFHQYFNKSYFSYEGNCAGETTTFLIDGFDNIIDSVLWDFGDSNSGMNNSSTSLTPFHLYPPSGNYYVNLTIYSDGKYFSEKKLIEISPTTIDLGEDVTLCSNKTLTVDTYSPNATYLWSNNQTTSAIGINTPGTYSVTVSIPNCPSMIDEITVNHIPAPIAELGEDRLICNNIPITFGVINPEPDYFYWWSNSTNDSTMTTSIGGTYTVKLTYLNGCTDTDKIFLEEDHVILNPGQNNLDCFNDSSGVALVLIDEGIPPFSFEWNNGDTVYTKNHLSAGDYSITVTDDLGCATVENFTITEPPEILVNIITTPDNLNTNELEGGVLFQPLSGDQPFAYEWERFGVVTDSSVTNLLSGVYNITITDNNGCEKIVQTVIETTAPSLEEIKLFPNPTSSLLFIEIPFEQSNGLEISITNILGQSICENYFLKKGKIDFSIDVSDWPNGIYFLKMKIDEEEKIWKFNIMK